jgi:hypothetical protein
MSFIQKNKRKIVFITLVLLVSAAAAFSWLQWQVIHTTADLDFNIYPSKLTLKDTLHYKDNTSFGKIRRWEFGDGNISLSDSGLYQYKKPGYYQIRLIVNNEYTKSFPIQVLDTLLIEKIEDSVTTIDAPTQAMQFENIVFRTQTKRAKLFRWKFGETGNIDSKDPMAIYAYQNPGDYVVILYTEETQYPILHKIKILPSFKVINDSVSLDDVYKKIDDDFKYHLQQIANGNSFNEHYNYLLSKYLCNNENAVMKINNAKLNNFNSYCLGLQFDKNTVIQAAKVGFDDKQNCVTKVEIQQGK